MRIPFPPAALSLAALLVAAPFLTSPALADEIDAASKIDAVTVYPDAAIVTRIATIDLPEGDSALVFKDLPLTLDPASLRIAGDGEAKIVIGSVDASIAPAAAKAPDNAIEAKLANLRQEREGWQSTIDALQAKRTMIVRYSQAGPEKLSPDAKPLEVGQWNAAWDTVSVALAKVGDDLRPALAKAKALDEEIEALEAERQRPEPASAPRRTASVALSAAAATKAHITLSYRIAGVGWRPVYDASLDTSGPAKTVSLARRALLAQRTGEDWSDVALTVSTARVARSVDVPDVQAVKIDFWQPPVAYEAPAGGVAKSAEAARTVPAPALGAPAPDIVVKLGVDQAWGSAHLAGGVHEIGMQDQQSQIATGAYSAEFKVPGRVSLPGDGAQKSFVLARLDAQPTLLVKTAPSLDQTAYLEAHFTDASEAPLLPGEVALHRDGAFVGQGQIAFVAPGDGLDLGFGADDKIKIQRAPVNRKENEPTWYNQTKVETREFKTTIKNLHDFPVKAQVIDQLPYSENTAITVELLPATTAPTEKQVADKRGVMSWTLDLQPGESKDLRLAYRLKWPADHDVTIGGEPIAR